MNYKFGIDIQDGEIVYIGDISYVMSEETNSNWASNGYTDGYFEFKGSKYGAFSTAYGDGHYVSSLGNFSVDSGTIGFIKSDLFSKDHLDNVSLGSLIKNAKRIDFDIKEGYFKIIIEYNNGEIVEHEINTDDDNPDKIFEEDDFIN